MAGAAIGANVGRDNETSTFQDVQRCERVAMIATPPMLGELRQSLSPAASKAAGLKLQVHKETTTATAW